MDQKTPPLDLQLANLHKRLLRKKLADITRLLWLEGLDSAWVVTPEQFRSSLERCEAALDRLTGVPREVRRLVWLNEILEGMADETKGRPWIAGEPLAFPIKVLARFSQESLAELPDRATTANRTPQTAETLSAMAEPSSPAVTQFQPETENPIVFRYVGQYLAACIASKRRGRPHRGSRAIPEKWVAFRDLAEHLGLTAAAMPVDSFRRKVLRGKQLMKMGSLQRSKG